MGGFGSGRHSSNRPLETSFRRLDVAYFARHGLLMAGSASTITWSRQGRSTGSIEVVSRGDSLRLTYRTRGRYERWQDVEDIVPLSQTTMHLGGQRVWFLCPRCSYRCRVLYGGTHFWCRHCHHVRYASTAETKADRATRAMFKIVRRLKLDADYNFLPPKPTGMHWHTYERLMQRYKEQDARWHAEAVRRFGIDPSTL